MYINANQQSFNRDHRLFTEKLGINVLENKNDGGQVHKKGALKKYQVLHPWIKV